MVRDNVLCDLREFTFICFVTISVGTASQASFDSKKRTEATEDGDGGTLETAQNAEVTSGRTLEVASDNHDLEPLVQVTSYKHVETQQISSDRVVRVKDFAYL